MERASRPSARASSSKKQMGWAVSGSAFLCVPAVTTLGMDSGVAGLTQGDKIVSCVCAAFRERHLVMNLLGGGQSAFPLAQLAQRVLLDVPVTDAFPGAAIPAAYSRVTVVLLVAFGFRLGVLLAESAIRQLGTAGVRTGALGFCRHRFTSLWA